MASVISGDKRDRTRRRGVTIVELLVVIAFLSLLVRLLLPAVNSAREAARRVGCASRLRQIGLAIDLHVGTRNYYPPGQLPPKVDGGELIAWSVVILPYLEQQALYDSIDFQADLRAEVNRGPTGTRIKTYLCPSSIQTRGNRVDARLGDFVADGRYTPNVGEEMGCIDYLGVCGPSRHIAAPNGLEYAKNQGVLVEVVKSNGDYVVAAKVRDRDLRDDGLGNTFMVAESTTRSVWDDPWKGFWELSGTWASGQNTSNIELGINEASGLLEENPEEEIFSDHPHGAHLLFADGAVHFANQDVDVKILACLCSRNGIAKWGEGRLPATPADLE